MSCRGKVDGPQTKKAHDDSDIFKVSVDEYGDFDVDEDEQINGLDCDLDSAEEAELMEQWFANGVTDCDGLEPTDITLKETTINDVKQELSLRTDRLEQNVALMFKRAFIEVITLRKENKVFKTKLQEVLSKKPPPPAPSAPAPPARTTRTPAPPARTTPTPAPPARTTPTPAPPSPTPKTPATPAPKPPARTPPARTPPARTPPAPTPPTSPNPVVEYPKSFSTIYYDSLDEDEQYQIEIEFLTGDSDDAMSAELSKAVNTASLQKEKKNVTQPKSKTFSGTEEECTDIGETNEITFEFDDLDDLLTDDSDVATSGEETPKAVKTASAQEEYKTGRQPKSKRPSAIDEQHSDIGETMPFAFEDLDDFLKLEEDISNDVEAKQQFIDILTALEDRKHESYAHTCWRFILTDKVAKQVTWYGTASKMCIRETEIARAVQTAFRQRYDDDEVFIRNSQRFFQYASCRFKNVLEKERRNKQKKFLKSLPKAKPAKRKHAKNTNK